MTKNAETIFLTLPELVFQLALPCESNLHRAYPDWYLYPDRSGDPRKA